MQVGTLSTYSQNCELSLSGDQLFLLLLCLQAYQEEEGGGVMVPPAGLEGQRNPCELLVSFTQGFGIPNLGPMPMRTLKFPRHL